MSIIPDSIQIPQSQNWKQLLSNVLRNSRELLEFCQIDTQGHFFNQDCGFPLRVTRYYASLIEKGNAADPLLLQVLPDIREREQAAGYSLDPVGDLDAMAAPGLIHKYRNRVLLTLTGACAIHCRYCFRRHFPYSDAIADISLHGPIMSYLRLHPEINEVILSGGDPLIMGDDQIARLVQNLNHFKHIRLLRIHSRLLSVLPERITDELMQTLQGFHGQVVWVTHINHANEISTHNQQAFTLINRYQQRIFNQSVLLNHVNADVGVLSQLSYVLFESGITPYYLHRLDRVQGSQHFALSDSASRSIYRELKNSLPGYLLPRLVDEIAGKLSKTTVHCE
jgi:L-lysine 2,3-aminomutase